MPKPHNQKHRILFLMRYLLENTDENHPLTAPEIRRWLEEQDMPCERKTFYDDLQTLRDFGIDVTSRRQGNDTLYFIGSRDFQLPELKLLVDSIQSSRFLTQRKSLELIGKLEKLTSTYEAKLLHRQVFVANRIKSMNESIYYNVDRLHDAIATDRQIRFRYFDWSVSKEPVYRHDGAYYAVSPFSLLWDNENYYLLAYDSASRMLRHYRVDKMSSLSITKLPREGKAEFDALDLAAYAESRFGMFSGEATHVQLRVENRLAGAIIDRFGRDVILAPDGEEHFIVTVRASVNAQFFGWLCGFGSAMKLVGPPSAVSAMAEHVRSIAENYGSD